MEIPRFSSMTVISAAITIISMVFYLLMLDVFALKGTIFYPTGLGTKWGQLIFLFPVYYWSVVHNAVYSAEQSAGL